MTSERLMWIIAIAVCAMPTSAVPLAGQDMQAHKHQLIDLGTPGRSAQRETDGEISSCSKEERSASTSEVPPLGYVVHGACSVNQNASTLTGYCQGPILFSHTCSSGKDASQCPSGQKAKEPEWITCGNFAVIRVDDKRPCEFVFK